VHPFPLRSRDTTSPGTGLHALRAYRIDSFSLGAIITLVLHLGHLQAVLYRAALIRNTSAGVDTLHARAALVTGGICGHVPS